jgi:hypothetical protein
MATGGVCRHEFLAELEKEGFFNEMAKRYPAK